VNVVPWGGWKSKNGLGIRVLRAGPYDSKNATTLRRTSKRKKQRKRRGKKHSSKTKNKKGREKKGERRPVFWQKESQQSAVESVEEDLWRKGGGVFRGESQNYGKRRQKKRKGKSANQKPSCEVNAGKGGGEVTNLKHAR